MSLLSAAVTITACGSALHIDSDPGAPIAVLRASIEGHAPETMQTGSLRAGLVWAALDPSRIVCTEAPVARCSQQPDDFRAQGSSNTVEIAPIFPASFEVPLHALPEPSLLGDTGNGLFGYAELVLFDDGNDNGDLDLVGTGAEDSVDTIVATGGRGDSGALHYVLYREGDASEAWRIFSALGCVEPQQGFSIARIVMNDPPTCWLGDAVIPVHFVDSDEVRALICQPTPPRSTFPSQPPPPDIEIECDGSNAMQFVLDPSRFCPDVQRYELIGCVDDPLCAEPEWDLSSDVPAWWPCSGS